MSEGKLDQTLDAIIGSNRRGNRRGRGTRRSETSRATQGPVGGVQKATKQKPAKAAPAAPSTVQGTETKLMISNLPNDVDENQLKDYFASAVGVGKPKKILLQYGPNGRSLGSATVIFNKHDQAVKATTALNGVKIDNRLIRVEMLVSAANIPPVPQTTLAERVTQPKKDKPKPVTAAKATPAGGRGRGQARGGRARGRGGRERQKKKTTEELDADMADYFTGTDGNADAMVTNGANAAQAVAGGDAAMDDVML